MNCFKTICKFMGGALLVFAIMCATIGLIFGVEHLVTAATGNEKVGTVCGVLSLFVAFGLVAGIFECRREHFRP